MEESQLLLPMVDSVEQKQHLRRCLSPVKILRPTLIEVIALLAADGRTIKKDGQSISVLTVSESVAMKRAAIGNYMVWCLTLTIPKYILRVLRE